MVVVGYPYHLQLLASPRCQELGFPTEAQGCPLPAVSGSLGFPSTPSLKLGGGFPHPPQHLGTAGVTPPAGVAGSLGLPCHFMPGLQFSCCNAHRGWEVRVFPATASRELVPQPTAAGSLGVPLLPVVAGSSGALQMLRGYPATPCASGRCGLCSSQPSEAEVTDSVTKSET